MLQDKSAEKFYGHVIFENVITIQNSYQQQDSSDVKSIWGVCCYSGCTASVQATVMFLNTLCTITYKIMQLNLKT